MKSWGATLVFLGVGSFVLPLFGIQFRLMAPLQQGQPWTGLIVIGVGVLLLLFGSLTQGSSPTTASVSPPPLPPQQPPPLPGSSPRCAHCKAEMLASDAYCPCCGQQTRGVPAQRSSFGRALVILILIGLVGAGIYYREPLKQRFFPSKPGGPENPVPAAPAPIAGSVSASPPFDGVHRVGDISAVVLSKDTRLMMTAGKNQLDLWRLPEGSRRASLQQFGIACATMSPNGDLFAAGLSTPELASTTEIPGGYAVKLWSVRPGPTVIGPASPERLEFQEASFQLPKLGYAIRCLAFSPDGARLIVGTGSLDGNSPGEIRLFDASTGQQLQSISESNGGVRCAAFSADGRFLATTTAGRLDASGFRSPQAIVRPAGNLQSAPSFSATLQSSPASLAITGDGRMLAVSQERNVSLWDLTTGTQYEAIRDLAEEVTALAFSPDGRTLAVGLKGKILLWGADSRQVRITIANDRFGTLQSLSFSPSGQLLFSGSDSGGVQFWDPSTGRESPSPASAF